ncbi:hypothetical protein [Rhodococcus sp. KBS0724]|uniref:hypothetical protein n=1 Tax=Rhodococcus sp. KBS0724 TaxID=1179674 RepID=UPI00163DA53A|nr:hypothetical protein [Rhodococcus sp. KBS0724]
MTAPVTPPAPAAPPAPPAPSVDPAPPATPPAPAAPAAPATPPAPAANEPTLEQLTAQLAAAQAQLAEAAPILEAHTATQEQNKTEVQKALDRADAAEKREAALALKYVAASHGIAEENIDLLGTGTLEEIQARAARIAALVPAPTEPPTPVDPAPLGAPPSQRPVEALKPGASPAPPVAPDDSYPASWLPPVRSN